MKILVFSDSHGRGERMSRMIEGSDADAVLFLGDGLREFYELERAFGSEKLMIAVKGNCDVGDGTPEERCFVLDGVRVLMLHGHTKGVKGETEALESFGRQMGADIVLYGHTHIAENRYIPDDDKPFYVFNPGSIGSFKPTFGYIEILSGKPCLNYVEYEEKI